MNVGEAYDRIKTLEQMISDYTYAVQIIGEHVLDTPKATLEAKCKELSICLDSLRAMTVLVPPAAIEPVATETNEPELTYGVDLVKRICVFSEDKDAWTDPAKCLAFERTSKRPYLSANGVFWKFAKLAKKEGM